jgi:hypothetical protein
VSRGEDEGYTIELTERSDAVVAGDSGKQRTHIFECDDEESCGQWLEALDQALSDNRSGVGTDQPLTPGVERRIRTGTQFRKKCTYDLRLMLISRVCMVPSRECMLDSSWPDRLQISLRQKIAKRKCSGCPCLVAMPTADADSQQFEEKEHN